MANWQIKDAENRFSELLEDAQAKGPQIITSQGSESAVVLSIDEYRNLTRKIPDLRALLLGGPKFDNFFIERDQSIDRAVDL